jgi:predicted nucleic acid-binding Zn ribbon protein
VVDSRDRKRTDCEPVGNILQTVLRNCHGGEGQNARIVWTFWDRIVGESMACNAQPAAFKQQTLVVHVSSSVWLQELHFQKKELIQRLNQAAGSKVVDDIRFKIGPLPVK